MQVIGLSEQEQTEIFRMLAIILWLGNVQFAEKDDDFINEVDTEKERVHQDPQQHQKS